MLITERLSALREKMREAGIDIYLVPTDDFHGSEYVGDYFKCREYITGFTGSAGTAVITMDEAGLWTDGRYFLQAERQLEGSTITLFKMGEPGVPSVLRYIEEKIQYGGRLGFDGRTVSAGEALKIQEILDKKSAVMEVNRDLIGEIWQERPRLSKEPVWELEEKWTGESRTSKIKKIRRIMEEKNADIFVLTSLDDVAWLLNLRGGDIRCCPVFLSYLVMTEKEIFLFANERIFDDKTKASLEKEQICLRPYDSVYEFAQTFLPGQRVLLSRSKVNSRLFSAIPRGVEILNEANPTVLLKAVKNPTEVQNERTAHIKDGAALSRFIYWLKTNVGKIPITELSAGEKLFEFRRQQEHFLGNSFDPIIAYGAHAAIVHYSAVPETDCRIKPQGLLLADTGGHYLEGTTDTTRTIVMGPLTEEEKTDFTLVLKGMLNLGDARFRYGCTGINLDYLAREPLWRAGKDFNHGTGHGVGYLLNVHEGPNAFRFRAGRENAVFEDGMITSDEPGYYAAGKYGIRHENLLVCKKAEKNEFGQFMEFEHLTMVPFDLEGILPELLTERERDLLNKYHERVYRAVSPYMNEEETAWLKEATKRI